MVRCTHTPADVPEWGRDGDGLPIICRISRTLQASHGSHPGGLPSNPTCPALTLEPCRTTCPTSGHHTSGDLSTSHCPFFPPKLYYWCPESPFPQSA